MVNNLRTASYILGKIQASYYYAVSRHKYLPISIFLKTLYLHRQKRLSRK